jgi:DNA replication and repair protein RecF
MYIQSVSLTNFRNYEHLDFEPSEGLNILVGPNAQGKSAILEAIYVLATSKSHRTSRDMDLIKVGESLARTCAHVIRTERNDATLEIILSRQEKKTVRINKVKHPKVGDIVGQLNAVIFSNSDIDMVRGEPSLRRRFLNLEISQISPQYIYS